MFGPTVVVANSTKTTVTKPASLMQVSHQQTLSGRVTDTTGVACCVILRNCTDAGGKLAAGIEESCVPTSVIIVSNGAVLVGSCLRQMGDG